MYQSKDIVFHAALLPVSSGVRSFSILIRSEVQKCKLTFMDTYAIMNPGNSVVLQGHKNTRFRKNSIQYAGIISDKGRDERWIITEALRHMVFLSATRAKTGHWQEEFMIISPLPDIVRFWI